MSTQLTPSSSVTSSATASAATGLASETATAPTASPASPTKGNPERLQSLDAYRGLIMFTLLCGGIFHSLKDDPKLNWLYEQNEHVQWEGCVYWDLIQPSFMFMVGVALPFAVARRTALGQGWFSQFVHVVLRALNLLMIGIILDNFGRDTIEIGFIRVLQQIAPGYVVAFFFVRRNLIWPALACAAILVGYNLLWMYNPYNGEGGPWAMGNENIGSVFDMWMVGRHYSGYYVGMNAIPSTATILFGLMAGEVLLRPWSHMRKIATLVLAGGAGIGLGLLVSEQLPLIKRIWTPSFAVYSAGFTTLALAFFYATMEGLKLKFWAFPLVVVGMNSIAAYIMGNIFGGWFRGLSGAWIAPLQDRLGPQWFEVFKHGLFAAAAWYVLFWLYRRKVFFKL